MRRLLAAHVQGIVTDHPNVAMQLRDAAVAGVAQLAQLAQLAPAS